MPSPAPLRLGRHEFDGSAGVVMAIVNRTKDSFYDRGASYAEDAAFDRVARAVDEGADIVDIGGVKAAPGEDVGVAEEIRRTAGFVHRVRTAFAELVISVDTWRAEVGREVCLAGADLLNDAWGGHDSRLAEVAAEFDVGLVCTHAGGLTPRTPPHRISYTDLVPEVVAELQRLAQRAVDVGVARDRILIDPGHDFNKNTWHSLELTRRLDELVATGWPVLVALSNKDFIGETLDRGVRERLPGTLAATAVCAWHGARVFRAHEVAPTRDVLDLVAGVRGTRPPTAVLRGLA